ncbi:MAG: TonB-dependent receptor [Dysgonamonadaceae bacterium]|nr:TonB-dependent receptor [Dysgonamonadaceae bacterium]MDD4247337.1 TonB-dependent receptor [Dysgonamonadaceae bacterium]
MINFFQTSLFFLFFIFTTWNLFAQSNNTVSETDTIIPLGEVIVNAYQSSSKLNRVPGSLSVLINKSISAWDANSMATTINSLPGVSMQSGTYATSRIVIRGMGSRTPYNTNRIKFYLNDIPITSSDGVSNPEDIDLQMIDRLEIVKGPASALYGSGLGGTINMYTSEKKQTGTNAQFHYGAFNTLKANISQSFVTNNLSLQAHLSATNSDGYRENNYLKKRTALVAGDANLKLFDLEYFFYTTYMNAGIPSSIGRTLFDTNPKAAAQNWKEIAGYKRYQKGVAGASFINRLNEHWQNKLMLFGKWNDSFERRPFNDLDDGSRGGGIRNKLSYTSSKINVIVGFEWITDDYKWLMEKDDVLLNKNKENRNHLNLFSIVYYQPTSKINISIAGAFNKIGYKLEDQFKEDGDKSGNRSFPSMFSPRIGINYAPHQKLALYASVGHGFSLPSPDETLLPEGNINPDIKPEEGVQYELGARLFLFNKKMEVDGTLYAIELDNLLVTKRYTEDIFTGINAGKTRHRGIELSVRNRLFSYKNFPGNLTSDFSYTFSKNKFIDFTSEDINYDDNLLPGIPNYSTQISFHWSPIKSILIDAQFQSVGRQFLDDANTLYESSYFLSNLKISNRFDAFKDSSLTAYIGVNNITNSHYASMVIVNAKAFGSDEPRYYYPGLPRHAYIGLIWDF